MRFRLILASAIFLFAYDGAFGQITIGNPSITTPGGRERLGTVINVQPIPPGGTICVQISGPSVPPIPPIPKTVAADGTVNANLTLGPGQGFAAGAYKIKVGQCNPANGQITSGQQVCFTVFGGQVKFVNPQMPIPPAPTGIDDDVTSVPAGTELVSLLLETNKAVFVSEFNSSITVEPTEVDVICVGLLANEADLLEVLESDVTFN